MQPGLVAVPVAQSGQLTPGGDERLLDGVLGQPDVAKDRIRDGEQSISGSAGKRRERFLVA